jgi:hypothetical protein
VKWRARRLNVHPFDSPCSRSRRAALRVHEGSLLLLLLPLPLPLPLPATTESTGMDGLWTTARVWVGIMGKLWKRVGQSRLASSYLEQSCDRFM